MRDHFFPIDNHSMRERARCHAEDGVDRVAERVALESYREMVNFLCTGDTMTRRRFESILATDEKEHEEDLLRLLEDLGCRPLR